MMSWVVMFNYRNPRLLLRKMNKMIKIKEGEEETKDTMGKMTSINKISINKMKNNKFMVGMGQILCQGMRVKMRIIGRS